MHSAEFVQIGNIKSLEPKRINLLPRSVHSVGLFLIICSQRRYTSHIPVIMFTDRSNWFTAHGGLSSIEVLLEFSLILPHVSEQLSAMKALQAVPLMVHGISA